LNLDLHQVHLIFFVTVFVIDELCQEIAAAATPLPWTAGYRAGLSLAG
jgi:hypothetical protein